VIALQLYSIRDHLQDPSGFGDVLTRVREIGYRAVEVAGVDEESTERFGAELRRAGLIACSAHISLEQLRNDVDRVVNTCKDWGCHYVVLPTIPSEYLTSADGYRRFASQAIRIADTLRNSGLQLAYHNHSHELERFGVRTRLETLLAETSPETLVIELDTYWLQYGGASPSTWIRSLRGRVPLVHLKDMAVHDGEPAEAEVGAGNLDWADVLSACRDAGTEWLIVELDESQDSMKSAAISLSNLTKLAAASNSST
jgi:sugar phosphate isomerase/epimerase